MNVSEAIRTKRATRQFQETPLPEDVAKSILNAGRRSQSSKNNQAWQFIAIRDKEILKALSTCGEWAGHIAGAAMAVAILIPDPNAKFQHLVDCGQAAAFMQLAAWELGVGSCPASIYEPEKAREIFLKHHSPDTPCAVLRNIAREGQKVDLTTLDKLLTHKIDMLSLVIIGNSDTEQMGHWMVTKRGYL